MLVKLMYVPLFYKFLFNVLTEIVSTVTTLKLLIPEELGFRYTLREDIKSHVYKVAY